MRNSTGANMQPREEKDSARKDLGNQVEARIGDGSGEYKEREGNAGMGVDLTKELPDEVLLRILRHLDMRDLVMGVSLVCVRWCCFSNDESKVYIYVYDDLLRDKKKGESTCIVFSYEDSVVRDSHFDAVKGLWKRICKKHWRNKLHKRLELNKSLTNHEREDEQKDVPNSRLFILSKSLVLPRPHSLLTSEDVHPCVYRLKLDCKWKRSYLLAEVSSQELNF